MKALEQVSPSESIILFLSLNCQACVNLEMEVSDIDSVEFIKYWVTPSGNGEKYHLRADKFRVDGIPIMVDADELPILPAAYDSNTKEMSFGVEGIMEYLESCGLIEDTP